MNFNEAFNVACDKGCDFTDQNGHTYKIKAFNEGLTPKGVEVYNELGEKIGYIPCPLMRGTEETESPVHFGVFVRI